MKDSAGANFMNKNKDGTGRSASCSDELDFAKHSVCMCVCVDTWGPFLRGAACVCVLVYSATLFFICFW